MQWGFRRAAAAAAAAGVPPPRRLRAPYEQRRGRLARSALAKAAQEPLPGEDGAASTVVTARGAARERAASRRASLFLFAPAPLELSAASVSFCSRADASSVALELNLVLALFDGNLARHEENMAASKCRC